MACEECQPRWAHGQGWGAAWRESDREESSRPGPRAPERRQMGKGRHTGDERARLGRWRGAGPGGAGVTLRGKTLQGQKGGGSVARTGQSRAGVTEGGSGAQPGLPLPNLVRGAQALGAGGLPFQKAAPAPASEGEGSPHPLAAAPKSQHRPHLAAWMSAGTSTSHPGEHPPALARPAQQGRPLCLPLALFLTPFLNPTSGSPGALPALPDPVAASFPSRVTSEPLAERPACPLHCWPLCVEVTEIKGGCGGCVSSPWEGPGGAC